MDYAIILCAGKGSRMNSAIPKYMMSILGKPMINYLLDTISNTCIGHTICVIKNNKEQTNFPSWVETVIQSEPLGTADAVGKAAPSIINTDGNTIIIPGDVPLISSDSINKLIQFHNQNANDLSFISFTTDNPFGYGRVIDDNGLAIVEERDLPLTNQMLNEVYSGIMCIKTALLLELLPKIEMSKSTNEYYLTAIVGLAATRGKVSKIVLKEAECRGANTMAQLADLEEDFRLRIIELWQEKGIYFENRYNTIIGPDVIISAPARIKMGTTILGRSKIGSNTLIGPFTAIANSIIAENTNISYSVITDSKISRGARIGPFAHIRKESVVGEENRIGNFVELKNTITGSNTAMAHLVYAGDTVCGSGVNFGCGAITVNYDGSNKYKTIIGSNAFIGCNSNLIAPITIEDGGYIAAGSTVTRNLEKNDFYISRPKEEIKHNYNSKYRRDEK